ncbi:zinc fingers and homeoboxes protein 2-like [Varroa jacobsoni]|uniref:zinc fingers and homeoboxes protein 2-like n=1 Tax=Varroa jacobsoni TaxID=62625 RepID=UPI000BF700C9|nr:zinc fingers and homeoboxes protein 2-like [Varroa jacobsoni]
MFAPAAVRMTPHGYYQDLIRETLLRLQKTLTVELRSPEQAQVLRKKSTQGDWMCNHCPYKSNNLSNVKMHETHHFKGAQFKCRYCSFSAERQNALISHELKLHVDTLTLPPTGRSSQSGGHSVHQQLQSVQSTMTTTQASTGSGTVTQTTNSNQGRKKSSGGS